MNRRNRFMNPEVVKPKDCKFQPVKHKSLMLEEIIIAPIIIEVPLKAIIKLMSQNKDPK